MYVKLSNGVVDTYPYTIDQLRKDNTQTSFPTNISNELLAEWEVFPVEDAPQPSYDLPTQDIKEVNPKFEDGKWVRSWEIKALSEEEIQNRKNDINLSAKQRREMDYKAEADPLFFKSQRGEISVNEWLAKVQEIKDRYPYVE